jgi:hypothetical protein
MTTQTVSTPGSGLVFVNTYTANDTTAYINCIVAAEKALEALWTNSVTMNITFDQKNEGNTGLVAENQWSSFVTVSYSQLKSVLPTADAVPSSDPTGGHNWSLPEAYARMLGLSSSAPATDLTVTLNIFYNFSYGQDVINAVAHEITEGGMGRVGGLGDQNSVWSTMDLFRYSALGVRDFADGRDGKTTFFSSDGSTLSSLTFNNQYTSPTTHTNTADVADFTQQDVFGTTQTGETNTLSSTDIAIMDALGWTQNAPPTVSVSQIQNDYLAITRSALALDQATAIVNAINAGTQSETQYVNNLLSQVANTTIPAVTVEASMYGVVGTSNEVTSLVTQFLPAQVATAIQFGFNPQVYASEALGLAFAFTNENSSTAFANAFGPSHAGTPNSAAGDNAFAALAATAIFGSASTPTLVNAIQSYVSNWKGFYTNNGLPSLSHPSLDQIDLVARGAAWGDAVGVALSSNVGPLYGQIINFLEDAAQGIAQYSMSLVGQPPHHTFA